MKSPTLYSRKWFFPLVYFTLIVLSIWPPYTQIPYNPRDTQDVIITILRFAIQPYAAWGWVFHIATLGIILLTIFWKDIAGRALAIYFGINYLIIAAVQTNTVTEKYGYALQTGAMAAELLLGFTWLWVAWKDKLQMTSHKIPAWRWIFLPLALLVFWSPLGAEGSKAVPNFDPLLLLTSPDYGLTYCFMTPVFLFLLILTYPNVEQFAFRVTAFNGLIYGVFNLTHWFNPDLVWLGVLHLPLLSISLAALLLSEFSSRPVASTTQ